ncbi:MAG: hypothetical protein ACFFEV_03070 [Candidatus Thorarchaeota archaeon]
MPSRKDQSSFDRLGIDVDSSMITILKAVMAASGGPSKFVTYKEIVENLHKIEKKKYTKAYIYRQLSALEEEGYLVIDSVQKPRRYAISEGGIVSTLERKREEALIAVQARKQDVLGRLNLLQAINPESFAFVVFNQLMGLEPSKESIVIEGIENVRNTVVREFGMPATSGDEIRVIAPASILGPGRLERAGMAEMSLMTKALDGVRIIGLLMPTEEQAFTTNAIANYLESIKDTFASFAASGNISLNIAKENIKTYRMVSLNREKMLLYLTHAADSDIAALIHRKDNPGLIDDAVDTFDRIFNEGINIMELVQQMLSGTN